MAGASASNWSNEWWKAPQGYQQPDISAPGFPIKTQDQVNAGGAPAGYEWDPIGKAYKRLPESAGQRAGQYTQGYLDSVPSISGLMGGMGGPGGAGGGVGGFGGGAGVGGPVGAGGPVQGGGGYVAPIQPPNADAAGAAAFATAKDNAGKIGRSSIETLNGELGAMGMLGSGAQVQGTRDIVSDAAAIEGQASRDAAMKKVDMAADFAKTGYAGSIQQRGQDIQAQEANARLALETRQAQYQQLALLLNSIGMPKAPSAPTDLIY